VRKKTESILELQDALVKTMADLVECRDDMTGGHIERTTRYVGILLSAIAERGLYPEETASWDAALLMRSSQLHDVGKITVKDSILQKPGKLTPEEFEEVKRHTTSGIAFIDRIKGSAAEHSLLNHARIFAASHHEKWDGSGYPQGLKGEGIPLEGRIMAIADVYDALVSERPYKKALPHEEAVRIIADGAGTHFDPALADLFAEVSGEFRKALVEINGN
jgi:putative two-component system response regulator